MAAALLIPDHPNSPRTPVFGGMKGCQFVDVSCGCCNRYIPPTVMKTTSTATLTNTIAELKFADSFMPQTQTSVQNRLAKKLSRSKTRRDWGKVDGSPPRPLSLGAILVRFSQWLL